MRIDRRARLALRFHDTLFVVLLGCGAALLAWVAERHPASWDWTERGDRTLSEPSTLLVSRIEGPVRITAYARPNPHLRRATRALIERYRAAKPDLTLEFVDPDRAPQQVRDLGITRNGEMVVEVDGRTAHATESTEEALTNALLRVAQERERWVAFLQGHGERDLLGKANHHLGRFGARLERRGYRVQGIELARAGTIPDNTAVLVISDPAAPLLAGEAAQVVDWIEAGGNLLWLGDPGDAADLEPIATALGVERVPGTVVEPRTVVYGIDNPALALSSSYPPHAATGGFDALTLYPLAAGLQVNPPDGWSASTLVLTSADAWAESGPLEGEVGFDADTDIGGPLQLAVALERALAPEASGGLELSRSQRVVLVGDGDFLSNTYLGNVSNLDLGLALVHWLAGDDALVDIPLHGPSDARLELSRTGAAVIALGSLIAAPLAFSLIGVVVWLRRRHR